MVNDIVSTMMELDQNNVKISFGAKDILTLPKGDPRYLDSYTMLERLWCWRRRFTGWKMA